VRFGAAVSEIVSSAARNKTIRADPELIDARIR